MQSLNPKKIYLFGSRARGDHHHDSDYDILVVLEDSKETRFEREIKARALLRGRDVGIDIFVYTQNEFDELKKKINSMPDIALNEGLELEDWIMQKRPQPGLNTPKATGTPELTDSLKETT